jgi:hypothetical protein
LLLQQQKSGGGVKINNIETSSVRILAIFLIKFKG